MGSFAILDADIHNVVRVGSYNMVGLTKNET